MNKQSPILYFSLGVVTLTLVLHTLSLINYWYWSVPWLDILMHVLGGVFIGMISLYIYYDSKYVEPKHFSFIFVFFLALSSTALIGVFWEFFEFIIDEYVAVSGWLSFFGGVKDTLSDLLSALIGSVISSIIYIKLWRKNL